MNTNNDTRTAYFPLLQMSSAHSALLLVPCNVLMQRKICRSYCVKGTWIALKFKKTTDKNTSLLLIQVLFEGRTFIPRHTSVAHCVYFGHLVLMP